MLSDVYQVMCEMYRMNTGHVMSTRGKTGKEVALSGWCQWRQSQMLQVWQARTQSSSVHIKSNQNSHKNKSKFTGEYNLCG
jgi:hypothetical protein